MNTLRRCHSTVRGLMKSRAPIFRIRQPVAGEPGDLLLLGGELVPRVISATAHFLAPHPDPSAYSEKFSGKYSHRTIEGGVGHNLPQEAPEAFARAVIDVDNPNDRSSRSVSG